MSACLQAAAQTHPPVDIYAEGGRNHVQGIAYDRDAGRMYMSFTTSFLKLDCEGNVLGSIDRIQGHLGAMVFNPSDRKVYASLEFKDDAIGKELSDFAAGRSMFYIAIIDVDRLDEIGMDSEDNDIFRIVCVREAGDDYHAKVSLDGGQMEHRYGCSGIDGVTIAPRLGKTGGRNFLYVAYGIYGDTGREDNDYQVLLRYDMKALGKLSHTVRFGEFYEGGPKRPLDKYFLCTGNTEWGVQNLAYDSSAERLYLAVYRGKKPQFSNFSLFSLDIGTKPVKKTLEGVPYDTRKRKVIGTKASPVGGTDFKWGSTGISPAGDGLFYFSENGRSKDSGNEKCNAHLYRATGDPERPFERQ